MNTDPLGHATTRGVNGYGVPTVTSFADMTSVTTTPSGQTPVDESDRFPDLSLDEASRPRDWTYDPTGVLTGATDLGGGPPWGYAYETHLGGTVQWDVGSGEVTLGHAEGRAGADTYTGSHPDRPEAPALEGESWRRQLRTSTSPEGEVTQRDDTSQGQLASVMLPWGVSTSMVYDADGEVDTQTLASGETVTFTHDAAGRYPNGITTTWTYDVRDRITSVTHMRVADGTVLLSRAYVRAATGEPTRITHEDGTYVALTYDAALRIASETYHAADDSVLSEVSYTYDQDGNRTSRTVDARPRRTPTRAARASPR